MWLLYLAVPLFLIGIIGSAIGGGIYTLVLIPIAILLAIPGFAAMRRRGPRGENTAKAENEVGPSCPPPPPAS